MWGNQEAVLRLEAEEPEGETVACPVRRMPEVSHC